MKIQNSKSNNREWAEMRDERVIREEEEDEDAAESTAGLWVMRVQH